MPVIVDYFLGVVITILVVLVIYKDGKMKEANNNATFLTNEISNLNLIIHKKDEEILELKKKIEDNDVEVL